MEEQITYRGHTITIERDYDHQPDEFDHPNSYGRGVWDHGPDAECEDPSDCWQWISIWLSNCRENLNAGFDGPQDFMEYFNEDEWIVMPVRGYKHSGWAFSVSGGGVFSDPWDSGLAGMVAIRKDLPMGAETKTPAEWAAHTVDHFEAYFNGYYYGYQVEGPSSDDSCWGYLCINNETDYIIDEAKYNIDWSINRERKQWFTRLKELIRNNVPLSIRNNEIPYERLAL